jgi:putative FmdB family regulatory protein
MPTYEYECKECKHQFEKFQSMSDEPIKVCEKCGKEVRKLFSSAGVIFKGSGFYVNDYKNGGKKSAPAGGCESGSCPVDSCPAKAGQ